jgi:transposase
MTYLSLSAEQQNRLRCELKQPTNAQVYRRAAALLALHQGRSPGDVASLLGVTRQTVYNWLSSRGRANQALNLKDAPRAGRPSVWTGKLDLLLKEALQASPSQFGYVASHWSAPLLREHLVVSHSSEVSPETVRRRLRRLGYNWTDGRYVRQLNPESDLDQSVLSDREAVPRISFSDNNAIAA